MHETIPQRELAGARQHDDRATGSPEDAVEAVFLSPRVVDAAAFSEFAQSLRHLLVEAAEGRERLGRAIEETDGVVERLRGVASQAGEKLRPAVRLIPTIDQKLKQAEEALERASAAAEVAERTAGEAARARDGGERGCGSARRSKPTRPRPRATGLEDSLRQAIERAEATVASLGEESRTRVDEATGRARSAMDALVAELDGKIEAASERLAAMLEERDAAAATAMGRAIEIASDEQDTVSEKLESRVSLAAGPRPRPRRPGPRLRSGRRRRRRRGSVLRRVSSGRSTSAGERSPTVRAGRWRCSTRKSQAACTHSWMRWTDWGRLWKRRRPRVRRHRVRRHRVRRHRARRQPRRRAHRTPRR
ncbi:MAG: hypothetical protein HND58_03970 [Planctomycetota bacterium]|nr:MAG: hypothetical protein HND58_03970 [Planctomycetota bacterium]